MKTQRGISMIEVAVTLAIMGILMAAAMPSVGDWIRNSRVRNTAESILNGLQQARMEAVRTNRPVGFYMVNDLSASCTLSSSSGTWVVSTGSPVSQCHQSTIRGLVSDGGGSTVGARLIDGVTPATSVTFSGLGRPIQSTAATDLRQVNVQSSDGTFRRRVEVSAAGAVRLCDQEVTATGDTRRCAQ